MSGHSLLFPHTKKRRRFLGAVFLQKLLTLGTHLSEALAAVYGTVGLGLEGNLCNTTAAGANGVVQHAGSAGIVLASVTAISAALGLVLETLLSVEFLLTCGENEFIAALFAN